MKRRRLDKIVLTEISAVDRPANIHARAVIMKRAQPEQLDKKESSMTTITDLENQVDELLNKVEHMNKSIKDASGMGDDFDKLVQAEIAKGTPATVAGQKVLHLYGARPNTSKIQKNEGSVAAFMHEVDKVMIATDCSRNDAMTIVRKRDPSLFSKFQEV
jgi:hypothetical protein